jgi:capsular polysaccharide biosynthesis protein
LGVPEEETNILDLWEAITSRKLLIFLVVLGFTLFTGFIAWAMPKQYLGEVTVTIVPATKDTTSSGSDEPSVDMNMQYTAEEITGMIEGREFLYRFIRDNNMLPVLFEQDWDKDKKQWDVKLVHRWIYGDTISVWDGYGKLSNILDVSSDDETGLTTVSIKWTDPKLAAEWANKIVDTANKQLRDHAINESNAILAQLEMELRRTSVTELQQALYGLMQSQLAQIISARVHPEFVLKVLDRAVVPEDQAIPYLQLILVVVGMFLGMIIALSLVLLLQAIAKHKVQRGSGGEVKRGR